MILQRLTHEEVKDFERRESDKDCDYKIISAKHDSPSTWELTIEKKTQKETDE